MTNEAFADALVPIAAELVGTVRDFGPDDIAAVLARVPDGRFDALAVTLAAMVDPDARPQQLLAWTQLGPVPSREFSPAAYRTDRAARPCPECGKEFQSNRLSRHRRTHTKAVA